MKPIRMKNRFGRRFIRLRDFMHYARELDILVDYPSEGLFEFLDREAMLQPVARVRFPPEIARRFEQAKYKDAVMISPVEGDTPRLDDAAELHYALANNTWSHASAFGEHEHLLDVMAQKHAQFVNTATGAAAHTSWKELSTPLWEQDGKPVHDGRQYAPIFYHYWQIFLLAALMRTGAKLICNPEDDKVSRAVHSLDLADTKIRNRVYGTYNLEARHEARAILEYADEFNAVAWFTAYFRNAENGVLHRLDKKTGKFSKADQDTLDAREIEIAKQAMVRYSLTPDDLLKFIEAQCDWWTTATDRGPRLVADEYKRNIESTRRMYLLIGGEGFDDIVPKVKSRHGYVQPILKVIFPSWLEEQRDIAERSLANWIAKRATTLPAPFAMTAADAPVFCDWVDANGLHQIYWNFSHLVELGHGDNEVHRAALGSEAVSLANLAEQIANVVLEKHHGVPARGYTLGWKLRLIAEASVQPALKQRLKDHHWLTDTSKSTLSARLTEIAALTGAADLEVLQALLSLQVIRNEGSHLGLLQFDSHALFELVETMVVATLMIWRMR